MALPGATLGTSPPLSPSAGAAWGQSPPQTPNSFTPPPLNTDYSHLNTPNQGAGWTPTFGHPQPTLSAPDGHNLMRAVHPGVEAEPTASPNPVDRATQPIVRFGTGVFNHRPDLSQLSANPTYWSAQPKPAPFTLGEAALAAAPFGRGAQAVRTGQLLANYATPYGAAASLTRGGAQMTRGALAGDAAAFGRGVVEATKSIPKATGNLITMTAGENVRQLDGQKISPTGQVMSDLGVDLTAQPLVPFGSVLSTTGAGSGKVPHLGAYIGDHVQAAGALANRALTEPYKAWDALTHTVGRKVEQGGVALSLMDPKDVRPPLSDVRTADRVARLGGPEGVQRLLAGDSPQSPDSTSAPDTPDGTTQPTGVDTTQATSTPTPPTGQPSPPTTPPATDLASSPETPPATKPPALAGDGATKIPGADDKALASAGQNLQTQMKTHGGLTGALAAAKTMLPPAGLERYWSQLPDSSKLLVYAGLSITAISALRSMFSSKKSDGTDDEPGFLASIAPILGLGAAAWGAGGGTFSQLPQLSNYKNLGNGAAISAGQKPLF